MAKKWCVIHGISEKSLFGHTQENARVLVSKKFRGMDTVNRGDIVEFDEVPFVPQTGEPLRFDVHFFAKNPKLIARHFEAPPVPVTRGPNDTRPSACEWKAQRESAANEFSAALQ